MELTHEEGIADHFRGGPGEEHAGVGGGLLQVLPLGRRIAAAEPLDNDPHQHDATGHLHGRGGERGADGPRGGMQDFEQGEGLDVAREGAEGGVGVDVGGGGGEGEEEDEAAQDGEPEDGGGEVVEEEVGG